MNTSTIIFLIYLYQVLKHVMLAGLLASTALLMASFYENQTQPIKKITRKYGIILAILTAIIGTFLPTERTIAYMIGAPILAQEIQDKNSSLDVILDKSIKAINVKLDSVIKEH